MLYFKQQVSILGLWIVSGCGGLYFCEYALKLFHSAPLSCSQSICAHVPPLSAACPALLQRLPSLSAPLLFSFLHLVPCPTCTSFRHQFNLCFRPILSWVFVKSPAFFFRLCVEILILNCWCGLLSPAFRSQCLSHPVTNFLVFTHKLLLLCVHFCAFPFTLFHSSMFYRVAQKTHSLRFFFNCFSPFVTEEKWTYKTKFWERTRGRNSSKSYVFDASGAKTIGPNSLISSYVAFINSL